LIGFEHLYYLLAIIPVFIAGWILVKRGANHSLIMSRVSVISLLIIALAGPYNPLIVTETDDSPSITVLSDETESMEFFEEGTAQEIFERLQGQTPVTMERMKGLRSDIGDEILSSSERSYHVVVVSDGNNNFGCDLEETIDFISDTGTSIYAITQTPMVNDLSVEITGGRTAVVGNENLVGIEVRQALSDARYRLSVEVDGQSVLRIDETQTAVKKTISFHYTFTEKRPYVITAKISSSDDMRTDNNIFNKTIYVVPKPEILLITSDFDSPMYKILNNQYVLEPYSVLDVDNLSNYKAVVLDNINNNRIYSDEMNKLRDYVANGRGLVVVGGDNSYDSGDYLSSKLEAVLPVESYPSDYSGSVNMVLVMDFSGSLDDGQVENMKAMGINLIDKLEVKLGTNANVGLVFFGKEDVTSSEKLFTLNNADKQFLINNITDFSIRPDVSKIDKGIEQAASMLTDISDEKYIIIFSDGVIGESYSDCDEVIRKIDTQNIHMQFYMINPGFLFCWDNIPGEDDDRLREFMGNNFERADLEDNWIENRKIIKSIDGKTIKLVDFNKTSENNSVKLEFLENEEKVKVRVEYGDTYMSRYLDVKEKDGEINIYEPDTKEIDISRFIDSITGKYFLELLSDTADGNFERIELDDRPVPECLKEPVEESSEDVEIFALVRLDDEHFITRYLNISGSISGCNYVTQKVGANRLVATSMGKPIVTSWQFGLGRVVSLSTDNGDSWAGALYYNENARLMPSIINWVVGDPQPDKGLVVHSYDMCLGSPGTITVLSDKLPSVSFDGQEVSMAKTEDRSFEGVLKPSSQGVFPLVVTAGGETIRDSIAVNYPLEYRDVGNNPEFLEAVKRNKGGVYYPEQATSLLFDDIMTNSVRTTVEHVDLRWIALLVALVVFLSEVIVRRVHGIIDIKDRRKGV
jgi:uncharacterized membrane protein